jgi:3-(3-hydroxy-phenyl)propionate hydroxylase
VLELARELPFARRMVNSGRLSVPAALHHSPLNTADVDADFLGTQMPGAVLLDAPLEHAGAPGWLLRCLGPDFTLISFGAAPAWAHGLPNVKVLEIGEDVRDTEGLVAQRLHALPGTMVLVRPDQHICARWRAATASQVRDALTRATAATA